MAENEQLEAFLAGATAPEPEPAPAAPPPETPEARVESKPSPESKPAPAKPEAKQPDDDDAEPPPPGEGEAVIPRRAYEDERRKRQDWKQRAAAAEASAQELRAQLEEARRVHQPAASQPQAPPPMPQPMPVPDPAADPYGYANYLNDRNLHQHFNTSEMLLRRELGNEKVDATIAEFKVLAAQNPQLQQQIRQQLDPYKWAYEQVKPHVEKRMFLREIGDDPEAWREAERQRLRAELEAQMQGLPAPARPTVPSTAPSLATTRSAAPRGAPAETGPANLAEMFPPYHERIKRAR